MPSTLVIGDIHGCYDELIALIDKAGIGDSDAVIALGDIVDRGPDTPSVLDFFRSRANATSILGNHERKHVRALDGKVRPALSQILTRRQIGDERYPDAVAFMDTLPLYLDLPDCILVHGFLEPGVALDEQRDVVIAGTLTGDRYLRERYPEPWYTTYEGPKPLVVGHHNYLGGSLPLVYRDLVFGLDTGCCHGRALTGLVLPEFRLVSVPAARDYWSEARRNAAPLLRPRLGKMRWQELENAARDDPPEKAPDPRAYLAEARAIESRLFEHVVAENDRILEELRSEHPYDTLTVPAKGRLYAERMGANPLKHLLHAARKGRFDRELLRRYCRTPEETLKMARRIGLVDEEPSPWTETDEED